MEKTIKISTIVTEDKTAKFVKSGDLEVFATPMMIALMEEASSKLASEFIDETQTTVGVMVNVSHIKATPVGKEVTAVATLIKHDERSFEFSVEAFDEVGIIGSGTHKRAAVNRQKFLDRLK